MKLLTKFISLLAACLILTSPATAQKAPPFALTLEKAQKGDLKAMYNLALMYETGTGTKKNIDEAVDWYERSADQNFVPSQYRLGDLYESGVVPGRDVRWACLWFTVSAHNNHLDSAERKAKVAAKLNAEQKEWCKDMIRTKQGSLL